MRRKTKEKQEAAVEEWNNKSNIEKAKEQIDSAERFPFAPGQTAGYTAAISYLLLEILERQDIQDGH